MFVDDEDGVRLSYDRYFSGHGFEVETAENGASAVSNLEAHPVDVVVADLKMPVMNGIQLLEWIQDEQPDTRFILLTGYGNEEVERQARTLGAYEYLNKPISPDTLPEVGPDESTDTPPLPERKTRLSDTFRTIVRFVIDLVEPAPDQAAIDEAVRVKGTFRRTVEIIAGLILAPILGLLFVIFLPVIGFGALIWTLVETVRDLLRPARA
jgi:CheY-like chemotaxis protein